MKTGAHFAVLFSIVFGAVQGADVANPTNQVVELISKLQTTMIMKGEASQEIYNEFAAWCTERAQELGAELKDGRADKKRSGVSDHSRQGNNEIEGCEDR